MTRFCLDRRLLGTKEHLVVDAGTFWWASHVPVDTWHLDGRTKDDSDWCLDTCAALAGRSICVDPPEPFVREMSLLSGSLVDIDVPWQRVMPAKAHQAFVRKLVDEVVGTIDNLPLDYYRTVWTSGNAVLRSLERCAIDKSVWHDLVVSGEGNVASTRSFVPDDRGLAALVKYDRFRTLTGRLTVHSGPQILTLKREHRKMLKSVYGDEGCIVALDFAALEARILLYEYGRKCDEVDLYGMIARELGYDRKAIKGAVISELYGSSKWALGKHLGIEGKELNEFVKRVQTYFNTSDLLARVKEQFVATGKVINRYSRPVVIDEPLDNIFISYYGQSTGVDVTMLGFKQVIDRLAVEAPKARPVYLLHDAILIDTLRKDLEVIRSIQHIRVKGYVQKFILKMEQISD